MDISFVIPTHNRPHILADTLDRLGILDRAHIGNAELIVVDNNSDQRPELPKSLSNGIQIELIELSKNIGAAARNIGADRATAPWIIMLDDDSSLLDCAALATLNAMPRDVHAIGGEIHLPSGKHEAGGSPEVVIGCGCAYRREIFVSLGYDPSFDFYAEEYDLCARILLAGGRALHHRGLQFEHRKTEHGRSFDRIIHRLVRNNGWVIARYAPRDVRDDALASMIARYETIARKEGALNAYSRGHRELLETIADQPRDEMTREQWDRFMGRSASFDFLARAFADDRGSAQAHLVRPGKGEEIIRDVLRELEVEICPQPTAKSRAIIGTLSPGPLDDARTAEADALRPWTGFDDASGISEN